MVSYLSSGQVCPPPSSCSYAISVHREETVQPGAHLSPASLGRKPHPRDWLVNTSSLRPRTEARGVRPPCPLFIEFNAGIDDTHVEKPRGLVKPSPSPPTTHFAEAQAQGGKDSAKVAQRHTTQCPRASHPESWATEKTGWSLPLGLHRRSLLLSQRKQTGLPETIHRAACPLPIRSNRHTASYQSP